MRRVLVPILGIALCIAAGAVPAAGSVVFDSTWGSEGSGDGQFHVPEGVAVDGSGNVYVADQGNDRVQKFTSTGTFLTSWGTTGTGDGEFRSPRGIAVDGFGNVYVTDAHNDRIQKFDSDGNFITKWGVSGTGDGELGYPIAVAVDGTGNVYVAEFGNNRISKFDSSGNFLTKWGTLGTGNGEFDAPAGVAVDSTGDVYVADTFNGRIQKFDGNGNWLATWGAAGSGDGEFVGPFGISVDALDTVYVADTANNRIQTFDTAGTFVSKWGEYGSGPGQFDGPHAVAIDGDGNVYVIERGNARVQKFVPDSNDASITIVKDARPNNAQDFGFTTTGSGLSGFTLDDDQNSVFMPRTKTFAGLSAGSYSVTEDAVGGWTLTGLSCNTGEAVDLANRRVDIALGPGEQVTCTFTNTKHGSIKIVKDARPNHAQDFTFTTTGSGLSGFTLDDDQSSIFVPRTKTFGSLLPGTYRVTEGVVSRWTLTGLSCDTGETVSLANRRVTIGLSAGENVTCTFVNSQQT
jgi:DNA-binding beta-propeller fold protein YncE